MRYCLDDVADLFVWVCRSGCWMLFQISRTAFKKIIHNVERWTVSILSISAQWMELAKVHALPLAAVGNAGLPLRWSLYIWMLNFIADHCFKEVVDMVNGCGCCLQPHPFRFQSWALAVQFRKCIKNEARCNNDSERSSLQTSRSRVVACKHAGI